MKPDTNAAAAARDEQAAFPATLRAQTAKQHELLEQSSLSKSLLSNSTTPADYVYYLAAMSSIVHFCEMEVDPVLSRILSPEYLGMKSSKLNKDIAFFEKDCPPPIVPPFRAFSDPANIPFALGYKYVLEGSTLGGLYIIKQLAKRLGVNEETGGTYFAGYGADTGRLWKNFLDVLSRYALENNCTTEIIRAARHAFSAIHNYFEKLAA